ncbi:MAG TPA: hypothetical protein VFU28_02450, partial [Vicinamibacterales bacterium]|nr:hypothetical protein [Vicinamibacterales bacterium]
LLALSAAHGLTYFGTVSRPTEVTDWTGDTGRVESFFDPDHLPELERRLGLAANGFTPDHAVVLVCGLTATIRGVLVRLIDRAFIPHAKVIRDALGIPPEATASLFYELYDATPVIDVDSPAVIEPLRARIQALRSTRPPARP